MLVGNVAVTCRDALVGDGAPAGAASPAGSFAADLWDAAEDGAGSAPGRPSGGRSGPLSVRQRFLLGRKVDVNTAGWVEISGLPGISDPVARAVVERRNRAGPFVRAGDLLAVRGIKEKRLEKILPFLAEFHNN